MRLLSALGSIFNRAIVPTEHLKKAFGVIETNTGISVTNDKALRCIAVFACIRVLAETIASLPLFVNRRSGDGSKQPANDHPLYTLLHAVPNPEQTSFSWREMMVGHMNLTGNHYSEIVRNGRGVSELWPLNPNRVKPYRASDGNIYYEVKDAEGSAEILPYGRVLHVPMFQRDGLTGLSTISQAREAIGLALATEEYGGRFFSGSASPRGILRTDQPLGEEAREVIGKTWSQAASGLDKAHKTPVLEYGLSWEQIGISGRDAQFLETRKYQTNEIARIFRVPPHMIGDLERATFSNVEQQGIDFVVHTIRPWLVRIEQAMTKTLMDERERQEYFIEFKVDGLLRGDIKSRYEAYAVGRQNGWLSPNEIRAFENMNPRDGGDDYQETPVGGQPNEPAPADETDSARFDIVIQDAEARILRRERHDVMRIADKYLQIDDREGFREAVREFYVGHTDYVEKIMRPVMEAQGSVNGEIRDHAEAVSLSNVKRVEELSEADEPTAVIAEWFDSRELGIMERNHEQAY